MFRVWGLEPTRASWVKGLGMFGVSGPRGLHRCTV